MGRAEGKLSRSRLSWLSRLLFGALIGLLVGCDQEARGPSSSGGCDKENEPQENVPQEHLLVKRAAINPHGLDLHTLMYSPCGKYLAVGTGRNLEIRDAESLEILYVTEDMRVCSAIVWHPRSVWIAAGTRGWNGMDMSHDPKWADRKAKVHLFDPRTGNLLRTLHGATQDFYALATTPDGEILAGGGAWEPCVYWWNLQDEEQANVVPVGVKVRDLALASSDWGLVSGEKYDGGQAQLQLFPLGSGESIITLKDRHSGLILPCPLRKDEYWLLCSNMGIDDSDIGRPQTSGKIERVRLPEGDLLEEFPCRYSPYKTRDISPDSLLIAFEGGARAVIVHLAQKRQIVELRGHYGHCTGVSFSPDGKYLATGGMEGNIFIWSVEQILKEAEK